MDFQIISIDYMMIALILKGLHVMLVQKYGALCVILHQLKVDIRSRYAPRGYTHQIQLVFEHLKLSIDIGPTSTIDTCSQMSGRFITAPGTTCASHHLDRKIP